MSADTQLLFSSYGTEAPAQIALPEKCSPWYAIRVRTRWEKIVAGALHGKGYDEFLPLYRKCSRWSDRKKEIDCPLFPGYVFCRADLTGRPSMVTTPGVIGILSFGGKPAIVSDEEIEAVKAVIRSGAQAEPWPYLREGQLVRVGEGALAGLEGVLVRAKSNWRVVLSIEALCRSVAVEIDREYAIPILPASFPRSNSLSSASDMPRL
ncbi:MAG: UpxY family transcription antiterminator [Acidobacteriaceae bacterium]|nr:UpxY family transcription antiterminator [Acidobacteriaceae bacterium]